MYPVYAVYMSSHYSKLIHVTVSPDLLLAIDEGAQQAYANRCEFVRQAVIDKIRSMQVSLAQKSDLQIDLLMTDRQLRDTRDALNNELRRRHSNKWHRPDLYQ